MFVFRLSRKAYANELSGIGAAKFGNRWNSKGTEIIYTAESRALAMAEVAVHLTLSALPKDYMMIEVEIPKTIKIEVLDASLLKDTWNDFPHTTETQYLGDDFIQRNTHCVLKVPSAVVKGDFNYIINPHHVHFKKISIVSAVAFPFDKRIFH